MAFLKYVQQVVQEAPEVKLQQLVDQAGGWDRVYLVFVDIIKGFCEQGALASERVKEMVAPVASLASRLQSKGLPAENFVFLHDAHPENAVEFQVFPPHCIRGTDEADIVEELKPFFQLPGAQVFRKNATNGLFGRNEKGIRFFEWLEQVFAQGKSSFIVVGDCTDLCIYQNAVGIRLLANEYNADTDVWVPISCVRTYDVDVETANKAGILAHDADTLDAVFFYHMQLNGIKLISDITE